MTCGRCGRECPSEPCITCAVEMAAEEAKRKAEAKEKREGDKK